MSLYAAVLSWIREIPDHLKTQDMCSEAVRIDSYLVLCAPYQYKTQQMCNELMSNRPAIFDLVSDRFKTQ